MKRGTKQFIKRLAAAAIAAACVLTLPASAAKAGTSAFTINASAATKKLKYYSSDYYDAASRDMIDTVLKPTILRLKYNAEKYGYTYTSEETLKKDAGIAYMLAATASEPYDSTKYVCEGFATFLQTLTNEGWVHGTKMGIVRSVIHGNHMYNIITLDGSIYNIEPQTARIFTQAEDSDMYEKTKTTELSSRAESIGVTAAGLQCCLFRLNPLQVLKSLHPELFKNKAVFKEFTNNNPEIEPWYLAWTAAKYRDHGYGFDRFEALTQ